MSQNKDILQGVPWQSTSGGDYHRICGRERWQREIFATGGGAFGVPPTTLTFDPNGPAQCSATCYFHLSNVAKACGATGRIGHTKGGVLTTSISTTFELAACLCTTTDEASPSSRTV